MEYDVRGVSSVMMSSSDAKNRTVCYSRTRIRRIR